MTDLLTNMIPAIFSVIAGVVLARSRKIDIATIGTLVIFVIAPIVNFSAVLRVDVSSVTIMMPCIAFMIGGMNSILTYHWSKRAMREVVSVSLLASSASSANTLYYGLGIAIAILPPEHIPVFFLTCIGFSLSESVFGYYFLARTQFHWKKAVLRVLKLPVLSAVAFAILWRLAGIDYPVILTPLFDYARGALIILGSLILGCALGKERTLQFCPRLLMGIVFSRHLSFSMLVGSILLLDRLALHVLDPVYALTLLLFAVMPIANNTLSFAVTLNISTKIISGSILASNVIALVLSGFTFYFHQKGWF